MEAIINHIGIYDDGMIEISVTCNMCKEINYHNITNASIKKDNKIIIDFSKFGKRCCDNLGNRDVNTICTGDYKLYV